tara:strand:- start:6202 stop:6429 length:228 start_codon:yes stop_codon:yes gene_type:complete
MLTELTKDRYKALKLLAEYLKNTPRDLELNAVLRDIKTKDLKWVNEKIHYYLLRLLEESDCEVEEDEDLICIYEQ